MIDGTDVGRSVGRDVGNMLGNDVGIDSGIACLSLLLAFYQIPTDLSTMLLAKHPQDRAMLLAKHPQDRAMLQVLYQPQPTHSLQTVNLHLILLLHLHHQRT